MRILIFILFFFFSSEETNTVTTSLFSGLLMHALDHGTKAAFTSTLQVKDD